MTNYGVGTLVHPIQEPPAAAVLVDPAMQAARDHVHIFAINGLNPLCLGNFNGFCGYLKKIGYRNTYFGQMYTCGNFARRVRDIRAYDPDAKIVLVGFSLGANLVRSISNDLAKDGSSVDLLVYMVGDYVWNSPASRPDNVRRIVNIRARGIVLTGGDLLFNGEDIDGARNERLNVRHILVPSRRETLELMTEELNLLVAEQAPKPAASPVTVPVRATTPGTASVRSPYYGQ